MYQTNPGQATKQFENLQGQSADRINSVLTPQQQTTWQMMTGAPYTFSPDIYFKSNANATPGGKKQ
jgi:hypothetical protein